VINIRQVFKERRNSEREQEGLEDNPTTIPGIIIFFGLSHFLFICCNYVYCS